MTFTDDDKQRSQNPFTDSDLKRLKRLNENQTAWGDSEMGWALDCLIPLLTRLEAAEEVIEYVWEHDPVMHGECIFVHLYGNWRKAAGK